MRLIACVVCFFVVTTCWSQTAESDTVDFQNLSGLSLVDALKYLDRNHQIKFSYNPDALENIVVPEIPDTISTVKSFLELCIARTGLDYDYLADTHILFPAPPPPKSKRKNISVNGIVIDKISRESLPFASIIVPGTKLSTTSNSDGKFTLMNIPGDSLEIQIS